MCIFVLHASACTGGSANPEEQKLLAKGCIEGNLSLVKTALANGADVNEPWFSNLPLYWAANENQIEVVKFLLDAGANIDGRSGVANRSALHEAALDGNFDLVRVLVEAKANVNIRNTHRRTPLYYVTSPPAPLSKPHNAKSIAEYLIAHGGTL